MRNLLYKEFKLCTTPTVFIFMAFVLMLLIPNYMYLIPAFFLCNAIFQAFQQGDTNNDLSFTMLLPVSKKQAVLAKYLYAAIIQLAMLLLYIPMILLNNAVIPQPNEMLDACPTLLGGVLTVFALFNLIFFPTYYKRGCKPGKGFLIATIVIFVWIFTFEGFFIVSKAFADQVWIFNWIQNNIDCIPANSASMTAQLTAILIGLIIYALLTFISFKKSVSNLDKVNL